MAVSVASAACKVRLPSVFIPHGGGPCFFMPDGAMGPPGTWKGMERFLAGIFKALPAKPQALLMCVVLLRGIAPFMMSRSPVSARCFILW